MRVGILISGRGGNMVAIAEAAKEKAKAYEVGLVVSNRPQAPGLARATALGLTTAAVDHKTFETRDAFDAALDAALRGQGIELVCLAGFMRILTPGFIEKWTGRLLNIHPSLLPAFRGLNVHDQALAAGVRISGCTVHFVTPELDAGPIVGQAAVPVLPGDTPETLAARIAPAEHRLYPDCIGAVARGDVGMQGGAAVWRAGSSAIAFWQPRETNGH